MYQRTAVPSLFAEKSDTYHRRLNRNHPDQSADQRPLDAGARGLPMALKVELAVLLFPRL